MQSVHTVEYDSAIKGSDVLTHALTLMKLGDIMLSELSQIQKDKHWVLLLRFIETESRAVAARG